MITLINRSTQRLLCEGRDSCECTVSGVQHAGAALSPTHSPDGRGQVHPGASVLGGGGGGHIRRDAVFCRGDKEREKEMMT